MSNESNRQADRTSSPTPSELRASDFFPPGHGWNRDESAGEAKRDRRDEESTLHGERQH